MKDRKKIFSILIIMILAVIATGCKKGGNDLQETNDFDKEKAFSEIVEEKDLKSYVLNTNLDVKSEVDPEKENYTYSGNLELIKEPLSYHSTWTSVDGKEKMESEEYVTDGFRYRKDENGTWTKEAAEGENTEEKAAFVSKNNINGDSILKPLKQYYEMKETDTDIVAELKSSSENIDEIKNIIFDDKDSPFYKELESIEATFIFDIKTNYPKSFEWELKFVNEDKKVKTIRQSGSYERVNELEKIEIPEELKSL